MFRTYLPVSIMTENGAPFNETLVMYWTFWESPNCTIVPVMEPLR
jgi:hypothetical protein